MNAIMSNRDDWFRLMCEQTRLRELETFAVDDHSKDAKLIEVEVDRLAEIWRFEFEWNISCKVSDQFPLFWIAIFDYEAPFGAIISACEELMPSLKLNWLARLELYPQISNGVMTGEPACSEFLLAKNLKVGWCDELGQRKLERESPEHLQAKS